MTARRSIPLALAIRRFAALAALAAAPLAAIEPPADRSPLAERAFRHPDLEIPALYRAPAELGPALAAPALGELATLGIEQPAAARLDLRGGRWATLLPSVTLLPEVAGRDRLAAASPVDPAALEQRAWRALVDYLAAHHAELRIDPAELAAGGRVTVHGAGELVQIYAPRRFRGLPVRGSVLTAVINHGNLVLFGAESWGDVEVATEPAIGRDQALAQVLAHAGAAALAGSWGRSELVVVPLAAGREAAAVAPGRGYRHRLAWAVRPAFAGELGRWEALVDAHTGELLSFEDTNRYATTRAVVGGVYPVTNDGVPPDGVEQAGWPMPFDAITNGGNTFFTDSGGNAPVCLDGNATSTLSGQFVNIFDNCGPISLTSAGDIDFGTSGGIDCTTPGFGGAGNTHSSRSGFHELNRIIEMAKGQLPGNTWLQDQLTANMNINSNCNAFWDGSTVNFFTSGGGCSNTGEIAGVFDHEWGHGMDNNDAFPTIASPSGEGIADVYAALRLNDSCIGRNFRPGVNCSGFGDPCLDCTGVRDIDWAEHASGTPHDFTWSNANCGSTVHCIGHVYSEAVWDLWKRDLAGAPYNMDNSTALEVVTRLTFLGGGNVGTWFSGAPPFGGCGATSGYLNFLAVDDDNGNINDGTPHMGAIFDAFDRHEIACNTPAVADTGCGGAPTTAPAVTATPRDRAIGLSWGAVTGASKYQVFRTDGVFACDFGKIKVGETTGTSFVDSGLQNGRDYSYVVIPIGPADSCVGPASTCDTAAPAAGVNLGLDESSFALAFSDGDGDVFLDNCESATVTFDISNIGTGGHTNVQIAGVSSPSHPTIDISNLVVSPVNLPNDCDGAQGSFDVIARGELAFNDTLELEVTVTSDQLTALGQSRSASFSVDFAESDFETKASHTFTYESDLEAWQTVAGTFDRSNVGGGGGGTTWHVSSSENLPSQCDQTRSPLLKLSATSTLALQTRYDIEPECVFPDCVPFEWFDRANVGLYNLATGVRDPVNPDGGRLYNADGANGTCGTEGQDGWADEEPNWGASTWSAAALGSAGVAGELVQLAIHYGTDGLVEGEGFNFDQVTLTSFDLQVGDVQGDLCPGNTPPTVTITAPAEGSVWDVADLIPFAGTASDTEDGGISASLDWSSDIDGTIGSGASFSTTLTAGYHTVTASVTDSGGLSDSDLVHVVVQDPPGCPADLVVDDPTVSGVQSYSGVNSVTFGPNTVFDATADVTAKSGKSFIIENDVEVLGSLALINTKTPCP